MVENQQAEHLPGNTGDRRPGQAPVLGFFLVCFFLFGFSTGLVRLYIAGLPLRSCRTIGAPSVQGSAQCAFFRFW